MSDTERRFEHTLDIEATPDEVWRALTEAGELTRWFPLQAEVKPGPGGSVFWSWGEAWPWRLDIADWQPGRRLLLHQPPSTYEQCDADGKPLPRSPIPDQPIAVEFTLEKTDGARTRLRLVHSGFGPGHEWDDEFDGISHGWPFELRGLRFYLGRHRGRDRHAALARASTSLSPAEAWRRLTGDSGFRLQPPAPGHGTPFSAGPHGSPCSGRVELLIPERELFGVVPALGDAQFRLSTHRAGGRTGVLAWLATWGEQPRPELASFQAEAVKILGRLFAS
jgi:uncharacterized protein YndB with AHSA1/START domain